MNTTVEQREQEIVQAVQQAGNKESGKAILDVLSMVKEGDMTFEDAYAKIKEIATNLCK